MKLHRLVDQGGQPIGWCHYCPGCGQTHCFNVEQPTKAHPEFNYAGGVKWAFDGNLERPSFSPSMSISVGGWKRPDGTEVPSTLCHYVLTGGVINYQGDCAHALVGKSVELPDYPERYLEPAATAPSRRRGSSVVAPAPTPPARAVPQAPATPVSVPEVIYVPTRRRLD